MASSFLAFASLCYVVIVRLAPESLREGIFTKESDVWMLGLTCWEVLTDCRYLPCPFVLFSPLFSGSFCSVLLQCLPLLLVLLSLFSSDKFPPVGPDGTALSDQKLTHEIAAGRIKPVLPAECPAGVRHLIESCWHFDPQKRPTLEALAGIVKQMQTFPDLVEKWTATSTHTETASHVHA